MKTCEFIFLSKITQLLHLDTKNLEILMLALKFCLYYNFIEQKKFINRMAD